jgi:hypothetical protein
LSLDMAQVNGSLVSATVLDMRRLDIAHARRIGSDVACARREANALPFRL